MREIVSDDAGELQHCRPLTASNRRYDEKGLRPGGDCVGQRGIWRLMGEVLLAGEEPQEWTALLHDVIADRAAQHGILCLECVEHCALRDLPLDVEFHLAADVRQR